MFVDSQGAQQHSLLKNLMFLNFEQKFYTLGVVVHT